MIVRKSFAIFIEVRGEKNDVDEFEWRAFKAVTDAPHAKMSMFSASRTSEAYPDDIQEHRIPVKKLEVWPVCEVCGWPHNPERMHPGLPRPGSSAYV